MNSSNSNITLRRMTLNCLEPDLDNILIVGIIIAKQRPRKFANSRGTEEGVSRAVWNFTIRDSPRDYINVTYWENIQTIFDAHDKYHTGDVVEIKKPAVIIRRLNDYGEQFRPMVTSPYSLTLSEESSIGVHNGINFSYLGLLHLPTKPLAGFVPLRDIHVRGGSMKDEMIDILGAVRSVGTVRNVTTKTGEECQLREVVLFDHTSPGLKITIWETDVIARAASWKSRTTILFVTDVKVEWSNFQRSYFATLSNRSVVTENPIGAEANNLTAYAKNAPLETSAILDQMVSSLPDPNSIQNVMSIQQVHDKVNNFIQENRPGDHQFTALLFAVVSQLDLDGLSPTTTTKCGYCKSWVKNNSAPCENSDCPFVQRGEMPKYDVSLDLRVMLSDHTGTLTNCRLSGHTAETVLDCSVQEFLMMSDDGKCTLKWKYLMERCAVRIMVLLVNRRNPVISIVSCSLADKMEVAQRLPVF